MDEDGWIHHFGSISGNCSTWYKKLDLSDDVPDFGE